MSPITALLTGRRVLSVDSASGIGDFLEELFAARGATLHRAATAEAARALVSPGAYDLVILDVMLPDGGGVELVRELRRVDDDCVLVVLTGAGGGHSATATMRAGADAYVEKQHLAGGGENEHLFDALAHAFEHRAGAVARRRVEAMKTDFYSMVTHDLRSPAGNVLVALRLLQSGKAGPLTPQQEQLVALADRSAGKVMKLIDDYLDFAKIDAGYLRLDLSEADLAVLVRGTVEQAQTQAGVKQQLLAVSTPPTLPITLDAAKVEQVLDNLLSNAVKYTPDGGTIRVAVERGAGVARVIIEDSGIGIPAGSIGHLFTKYHRVPGEQVGRIKGTGLGLLIIKEIVEAHRGSVTASSTGVPGEGSRFVVELPIG